MSRTKINQWLDRLQAGYWFVPLAMAVLAFLFAHVMFQIDAWIPDEALANSGLVYTGSATEARSSLLATAGSILTTAGVVFSLLTVPVSVAVSQFGSRLLRLYLRDRTIQLVLGMFVGTFVYSVAVALAIPAPTEHPDAPQLATTVGLLLTFITFGSLVVLIHHVITSLQAPNVAAAAGAELQRVIHTASGLVEDLPERDRLTEREILPKLLQQDGYAIHSDGQGYIQAIDPDEVFSLAERRDLVIRLLRKPGHFVRNGDLIAQVYPPQHVDDAVVALIRDAYEVGNLRTPSQDIEYGTNQLVEVAVRAMSPAINDPFTAMTCLEYIGAGLGTYARTIRPHPYFYDAAGHLRAIIEPVTFAELLDAGFNLIRRVSRESPDVLLAIVAALGNIAQHCALPEQRAHVLRHVQLVEQENGASSAIDRDKRRVRERCVALTTALEGKIPEPVAQGAST